MRRMADTAHSKLIGRPVQRIDGRAKVTGAGKADMRFACGAQFVEVRVHRASGEIRIPRLAAAFACGRIVNPLTARSQLMAGQIRGASSALFEATHVDRRTARRRRIGTGCRSCVRAPRRPTGSPAAGRP